MSYSDGQQYSRSRLIATGAEPTVTADAAGDGYDKHQQFLAWARGRRLPQRDARRGLAVVEPRAGPQQLRPASTWTAAASSRSPSATTSTTTATATCPTTSVTRTPTASPTSTRRTAACSPSTGPAATTIEKPYYVEYAGTDLADADSDGDGVRDGADDKDHDDIPNLMELSRYAASHCFDGKSRVHARLDDLDPKAPRHPDAYGRVNPFNPCLPAIWSRTCTTHPNEDTGAPFDDSPNWWSLN